MKNIYVCIKQVPDSTAKITIVDNCRIQEKLTSLLNPYDEHALAEACKIKKRMDGVQVIAICLGSAEAEKAVRSAMAMGADTGILINSPTLTDSIVTARALKAGMDQYGPADLIFTGREAIDTEGMQTMFRLGALYHFPVVNNVVHLDFIDGKARVETQFSGGVRNTYELSMPCVIGAGRELNTPRHPTFKDLMTSKRKTVHHLDITDLLSEKPNSSMELIRLEPLTHNRTPKEIKGDTTTIAQSILNILKHEAKLV